MDKKDKGRPSLARDAVLIGAAVPAGWALHDLARFATTGQAGTVLRELLPGSLVAVLLGAVLGWLVARRSFLVWVGLGLALALSVVPVFRKVPFPRAEILLPRALFLIIVVVLAGTWIQRRWRPGALRLGLVFGLLACLTMTAYRPVAFNRTSRIFLVAAVLTLAAAALRASAPRRAVTAVLVLAPAIWFGRLSLSHIELSRPDLEAPAIAGRGPNLLLVVLDTVRADHMTPYGYRRDTTPGLARFVDEDAVLYRSARSTSNFTLASHASLFTGLFPSEHGAAFTGAGARPLGTVVPTLAGTLHEHGYQTAAIVANTVYLNHVYGLDRGFEHYDDRQASWVADYIPLAQMGGGRLRFGHLSHREAPEISDLALDWLDEDRRNGPFFLMLNYLDAHSVYFPPEPYDELFSDEQPVDPLKPPDAMAELLYDRELRFLDANVTRLLDGLKERGLFENTVIVITADHGEGLGEHGVPEHCWTLYEELVHVPLFVKPIGPRTKKIEDRLVSGADVFGLALQELGLAPEPPTRRSEELIGEWYPWHPMTPKWIDWARSRHLDPQQSLLAWMDGSRKVIVSSRGTVEVYDLAVDPEEEHPLAITSAETEQAVARARGWWDAHPLEEVEMSLDQDQLERLDALGYK